MGFLGVYSAIYSYQPQSEGELEITEGELLYILDKTGEDSWWRAKKKAANEDEEEPVGLIPENYVEEAAPIATAKALYDYSRQTDEEISFSEDAQLQVFDTSDPDWTLVGTNGEFGFAPSNYIELDEGAGQDQAQAHTPPESEPALAPAPPSPQSPVASGPAAALAQVLGGHAPAAPAATRPIASPPDTPTLPPRFHEPEAPKSVDQPPALPQRPPSEQLSPPANAYPSPQEEPTAGVLPSPPYNRAVHPALPDEAQGLQSPGGYRMYNISEMVSAMGKRKKLPTTLGINLATGTIMLSPEKSRDGATQEWPADKLTYYSIEGKHVFIELIRPSKSLDLHAGSKETAAEIVSALGEIAGAARGEGLREVMAAASGGHAQKKGHMLYEFMAQGDDEVTVAVGDEVLILDDKNSDEWWLVRRLKNGKEGVVPSSYVEVTVVAQTPPSTTGINAGRSIVEQNRQEEERLAKEAVRSDRRRRESDGRNIERSKRESKSSSKPKPDPSKTRTWTDRSNSFKVEAQFIGLTDGKIHLHKVNGVKIAVPVSKMSLEDIEYVENITGMSLDEEKPLSDIRHKGRSSRANGQAGASLEQAKQPEYDWFDFFLKAGVGPHQCERYSQNFNRDSMDESILPDIGPSTLRTLGLKEGDILRVMKYLDSKYGRTGAKGQEGDVTTGGLFTGPDGTLRNNTSKGRPRPTNQASDVVDPKAFEQGDAAQNVPSAESKEVPSAATPASTEANKPKGGFDDDAWAVKRPKESTPVPAPAPAPMPAPPAAAAAAAAAASPSPAPASEPPKQNPLLTGAMVELSLLTPPLQPSQAPQLTPPAIVQPPHQPQQQAPPQLHQPGANVAFFSQLNPQQTGLPQQNFGQQGQFQSQPTGMPQQMPPRARPQPPQNIATSSLIAPPPRPLSAPQNFSQQSQFAPQPLQPQLTGIPSNVQNQAPPGQSLNELNQRRFQQQFNQQSLPLQPTGFVQQGPGLSPYANGIIPQQTGFVPPQQQPFGFQQNSYLTGNQQGSPFADPGRSFSPLSSQPTGFGGFQPQQQMQTGINSVLPPALQPQPTSFPQQMAPQQTGFQQQMQPQPTGMNGFGQPNFGHAPPPMPPLPPMPSQQTITPLQPQKTGPAPPVRFGVSEQKKLIAQPTGRRANLSQATPDNPFGF